MRATAFCVAAIAPTLGWGCGGGSGAALSGSATFRDAAVGGPDSGNIEDASPVGYPDVVLPSATEFADVEIAVDVTEPVWLPPPRTTIQGDATNWVGSWDQLASDGSACMAGTTSPGWCYHLRIQEDANGAVRGTIHYDPGLNPTCGQTNISGPFAPATDPNIGYPSMVSPNDYWCIENSCPEVDYQLFDGVIQGGSLTFWFSALDLWTAWCALQTPSPWSVGGEMVYQCAPQTADPSTTNLGKLALCTSSQYRTMCKVSDGSQHPCDCLDDAGEFKSTLPLCGQSVCECSPTECRARLRAVELAASLTLSAGKLVGQIELSGPALLPNTTVTFQRVGP